MSYSKNAPKSTASLIPDSELKKIITGDLVESARLTNAHAQDVATELLREDRAQKKDKLKSSQIRNIFGLVRQIEMTWDEIDENHSPEEQELQRQNEKAARRQLILLIPKLRYQAERTKAMDPLSNLLINGIGIVDDDNINQPSHRERFQRFVDLFEAILAYHKKGDE
jgi:CRISPR-associated protein Csm2